MNIKYLTLSILIFTIFGCNGKKEKNVNQELNNFSEQVNYLYDFLLKDVDYAYQTVEFNETDYFKSTFNEKKIKNFISKIKKEIIIEKSVFDDIVLNLNIELPKSIKSLKFEDLKIKLESNELFDIDNNPINLSQSSSINFTPNKVNFSTKIKNDSVKENYYNKFTGKLNYSFKFLIGYDIIKLNKNNIGEVFTLNNCKFKLISIFNNQIFIENLCKSDISSKVINLTKKGKMIEPYPIFEFNKLKKNNDTFANKENFQTVRITKFMSQKILKEVEKNPNISISKFNEIVLNENKNPKNFSMIKIFKTISETEFILCSPKYQTELIKFVK